MNEDLILRLSQMTQKAYTEIGPAWPLIMSQLLGALTPSDLESLLPDGMVIVPVKATCAMEDVFVADDHFFMGAFWKAMLAARPKLGEV